MAWFCFNDAFVSVVQSDKDPEVLMVRARAYQHLRAMFGSEAEIHVTPHNDYRFRVYTTKPKWSNIVTSRIYQINYSNFKDSVKDNKLHNLYADFWYLHMVYQNGKKWWKNQWKYLPFAEKDQPPMEKK